MGALATSQSTNPVPIELRNSLDLPELDTKPISGYEKCIKTMEDYARGLKKFEVPEKLTLEEAVGVFELWKGRKVFGRGEIPYLGFFNRRRSWSLFKPLRTTTRRSSESTPSPVEIQDSSSGRACSLISMLDVYFLNT